MSLMKCDKKTKYLIFLLSLVYLVRGRIEFKEVSLVSPLNDTIRNRVNAGFLAEKRSYESLARPDSVPHPTTFFQLAIYR